MKNNTWLLKVQTGVDMALCILELLCGIQDVRFDVSLDTPSEHMRLPLLSMG